MVFAGARFPSLLMKLFEWLWPSGASEVNWFRQTYALRKPDLRKNLDLWKIVATTDFLVHKLFDLRKIF